MRRRDCFIQVFASLCVLSVLMTCGIAADEAKESAKPATIELKGNWFGTLDAGGVKLRLGFVIDANKEGKLTGKLFSIDQGNVEIPVQAVEVKDAKVIVNVKRIFAQFEGTWDTKAGVIVGKWTQGPQSFPLTLNKVDTLPGTNRPQDPKKPYPYREEEVEFKNPNHNVTMKGTLTLPKGKGPFPAVVLISGSGPQDRNEELLGHRPFLVLADALTRRGIVVLRFDDRDFTNPKLGMQVTCEDMAGDVMAAVKLLQSRAEVASDRIGLIGHSEGGLIAPMLAAREKDIAFIVMIAGPGIPGDQILALQSEFLLKEAGLGGDKLKSEIEKLQQIHETIKAEPDNGKVAEKLDAIFNDAVGKELKEDEKKAAKQQFDLQARIRTSPWFRYFLNYDPQPALTKVTCPVLAVIGEKDFQVPAKENAPAIEAALKEGHNADYEVKVLPGLNHLLQPCSTGTIAEYATIETTIHPDALKLITDWVVKHTKS